MLSAHTGKLVDTYYGVFPVLLGLLAKIIGTWARRSLVVS